MSSLDDARNMKNKPIVVAGIALSAMPVTLGEVFTQNEDLLETAARKSAALAYAQAGISSKDLDFAEIYDCFTASFLIQMEDLGICGHGEGTDFLKGGTMAPGGSFPMNTHGGHLSNGYVPGANHVVEAVRQLRGERGAAQVTNAEIGLVAGLAGNEHATMILTVDR
jgi:acetyl-CoA acetyltransferase